MSNSEKLDADYEILKNHQWLIMMVGIPGSGKTTFAARLTKVLGAYRFNMDLLRGELFGTANRREQIQYEHDQTAGLNPEDTWHWNIEHARQINQAYDKQLSSYLKTNQSIVIDYSCDSLHKRDYLRYMAKKNGVFPIVAWMQIPIEVAIQRATHRELRDDSFPFNNEDSARKEIECCLNNLDSPQSQEHSALIDGQADFNQQLSNFISVVTQALNKSSQSVGESY